MNKLIIAIVGLSVVALMAVGYAVKEIFVEKKMIKPLCTSDCSSSSSDYSDKCCLKPAILSSGKNWSPKNDYYYYQPKSMKELSYETLLDAGA